MKKEKKINNGFAIHVHHDDLVEYCYDYKKRVEYIKTEKPENEQEIRLRVFKILPEEALNDLPEVYRKAHKTWPQKSKNAFHKKWCVPECPWDGSKLVFKIK